MSRFKRARILDLRRDSSALSKRYARAATARLLRTTPQRDSYTLLSKGNLPRSRGPHIVRIKALEGRGRFMRSRPVEISCTCEFWKFYGSDVNALANDYSERRMSNGKPPKIRDPARENLVCKHVVASIRLVAKLPVPSKARIGEVRGIIVSYKGKKKKSKVESIFDPSMVRESVKLTVESQFAEDPNAGVEELDSHSEKRKKLDMKSNLKSFFRQVR